MAPWYVAFVHLPVYSVLRDPSSRHQAPVSIRLSSVSCHALSINLVHCGNGFRILFPFGLWVFKPDWLLDHSQLVCCRVLSTQGIGTLPPHPNRHRPCSSPAVKPGSRLRPHMDTHRHTLGHKAGKQESRKARRWTDTGHGADLFPRSQLRLELQIWRGHGDPGLDLEVHVRHLVHSRRRDGKLRSQYNTVLQIARRSGLRK